MKSQSAKLNPPHIALSCFYGIKKGALKEPLLLYLVTEVTFKVAALVKRAVLRLLEIVDETCIDGTTHRNLKTTD